jgi:hypothetical protein
VKSETASFHLGETTLFGQGFQGSIFPNFFLSKTVLFWAKIWSSSTSKLVNEFSEEKLEEKPDIFEIFWI